MQFWRQGWARAAGLDSQFLLLLIIAIISAMLNVCCILLRLNLMHSGPSSRCFSLGSDSFILQLRNLMDRGQVADGCLLHAGFLCCHLSLKLLTTACKDVPLRSCIQAQLMQLCLMGRGLLMHGIGLSHSLLDLHGGLGCKILMSSSFLLELCSFLAQCRDARGVLLVLTISCFQPVVMGFCSDRSASLPRAVISFLNVLFSFSRAASSAAATLRFKLDLCRRALRP